MFEAEMIERELEAQREVERREAKIRYEIAVSTMRTLDVVGERFLELHRNRPR